MAKRRTIAEQRRWIGAKPIRNIGGKLERDYNSLKSVADEINYHFFPFMYFLGLTRSTDTEKFLEAIAKGNGGIREFYYERVLEDMEAGKIRKENIINKKWIVTDDTPPDEREEKLNKERGAIHRACTFRYKEAIEEFRKRGGYWRGEPLSSYFSRYLEPTKSLLYLSEDGLEIDYEKFVEFYKDFIAAEESETKEQHLAAVNALNRFFNGGVEITEKEFFKYFKIEDGIFKINPTSVNLESYSRLGARKIVVTKDK